MLRDRSRSLFPFLTVAIGVSLVVVMDTYLRGVTDGMFQTLASFTCGHLRVTGVDTTGRSQGSRTMLADVDHVLAQLEMSYPGIVWTPRSRFSGLVQRAEQASGAALPVNWLALDLSEHSPELWILRLKRTIVAGVLPTAPGEVLLAQECARRLGVKPGERVILTTAAGDGRTVKRELTIAGTVRFGVSAMDRGT
ncbi:MAG: ABC transporter permease, partial [candidate division WOR-3 bacterium]